MQGHSMVAICLYIARPPEILHRPMSFLAAAQAIFGRIYQVLEFGREETPAATPRFALAGGACF
jgi:hypothetical protein